MSDQTFRLPDLGEGLTEAEVVRWLVTAGEVVAVDQAVVEVETAKSLVEVPSPYAGRVSILHAAEGETVDVGQPLITVAANAASPPAETYRAEERAGSGNVLIGYGTSGTSGGPATARRRRPRVAASPSQVHNAPSVVASPSQVHNAPSVVASPSRVREAPGVPRVISPLVRIRAREAGLDLASVAATGPGGVITRSDVEKALTPAPAPAGERRIPLSGFRKAVSAALTRSRAEIPEATVWVDVDATPLWELRESTRTAAGPGPGLTAYLARFVVAALRQHPVLNARLDTERQEIVEFDRINLGIAVQGDRGLVVPAVLGAETMTTAQLDDEIRRVTAAARAGRVPPGELAAGTFTLNNYGGFRVDGSAAIINHPQVAMLGIGRILDRPWVVAGEIRVRKIAQLSFVFDHRVCDGGTAAGFLRSVADAIEDPASAIARL